MSAGPDFSIIIPTHRRRELLLGLLARLRLLSGPTHEVIVIDDASSDGTAEALRKDFPEVKVMRNSEPLGFDALPEAVALARGRFIIQLDDDAYPAGDALKKVLEHFERRGPTVGVVAMPFVEAKSGRLGYSPYFPALRNGATYGPARGFAAGAVAVRREAALEIPLSPPGYFMYETEVPATIEFLRNGWEVDFLPDARVFHIWEARGRQVGARSAYLGLRNDIVTIKRYFQGWRRAEMLMGRYITGFLHLLAAGRPGLMVRAGREAREMLSSLPEDGESVPKEVLDRVYPSFDGLTLMTIFGETNRRRLAWFLGRLPIDQVA
ncbi:MAG: glycosyltransferase [Trueperaceae bacterium]